MENHAQDALHFHSFHVITVVLLGPFAFETALAQKGLLQALMTSSYSSRLETWSASSTESCLLVPIAHVSACLRQSRRAVVCKGARVL